MKNQRKGGWKDITNKIYKNLNYRQTTNRNHDNYEHQNQICWHDKAGTVVQRYRAGLLITGALVRTHSGASFVINFASLSPASAQFSLNNVHKRSLKHHHFIFADMINAKSGGKTKTQYLLWLWVLSSSTVSQQNIRGLNSMHGKHFQAQLAQFSLSNVHKRGLKHHHFISLLSSTNLTNI